MNEISALYDSSAPIILCDAAGKIIWRNQSANSWAKGNISLHALVGERCAGKILSTLSYELVQSQPNDCPSSCYLSIDVSAGDPDDVRFLVVRLNTMSPEKSLEDRELALTTVAHDLKTPLSAIFGYVDALLDTSTDPAMSPSTKNILVRIRRTSARAIELVKNYQALALIKYSKAAVSAHNCDICDVVNIVVDSLWRDDSSGSAIKVHAPKHPVMVPLSRSFSERVVANLLSNALNYKKHGTDVSITILETQSQVKFSVHNFGTAIDATELPRIFDPYKRAKNSSQTSGLGLGLHIVKTLVDAAGGSIDVQSDPDSGTTFSMILRRNKIKEVNS